MERLFQAVCDCFPIKIGLEFGRIQTEAGGLLHHPGLEGCRRERRPFSLFIGKQVVHFPEFTLQVGCFDRLGGKRILIAIG